jgi:hypothetical protein
MFSHSKNESTGTVRRAAEQCVSAAFAARAAIVDPMQHG